MDLETWLLGALCSCRALSWNGVTRLGIEGAEQNNPECANSALTAPLEEMKNRAALMNTAHKCDGASPQMVSPDFPGQRDGHPTTEPRAAVIRTATFGARAPLGGNQSGTQTSISPARVRTIPPALRAGRQQRDRGKYREDRL